MEGLFTFADERKWGSPRLEERFKELQQHENDPLSDERRFAVQREMCHIAFEGLQRQKLIKQLAAFEEQFTNQPTLPGVE